MNEVEDTILNINKLVNTSGYFSQEKEYLIKWQGWAMDACTWEPASNLGEELIR